MAECFLQLVVSRASVKLTLGHDDEQASDQLTLQARLDALEQDAFERDNPQFARPEGLREVEQFTLNVYSSESAIHRLHTNMRTIVENGRATVNFLDKPEDIALASRYFADFGRSDVFKAEVHLRAEGHDYVPLAVDLTMSRGLVA